MGIFSIVALMMLAVTLAMFIAGIWLLVRSRRGGPAYPSCGGCSYDMTGSIGKVDRCPECGVEVAVAGITPPGGERSMPRVIAGVLLLVFSVTCVSGFLFATLRPVRATRSSTIMAAPSPPPPPSQQAEGPADADAPAADQPE